MHLWLQVRSGLVYFPVTPRDARSAALSSALIACGSGTGPFSSTPPASQPGGSPTFQQGATTTPCVIQPVTSHTELQAALSSVSDAAKLPTQAALLIIQLQNHVRLVTSLWPEQGVSVAAQVTLVGRPPSKVDLDFSGYELDFAGVPLFVRLDQQLGSIAFVDMCLTNMALGADRLFPSSLLVGAVWVVEFDRCVG